MAPKSKQNGSKACLNTEVKNDAIMVPSQKPNGAKMDAKRHPKCDVFFDGFSDASGNIDGTAVDARVSHFLQPTPQGGAILSKNIVQKQAKTV